MTAHAPNFTDNQKDSVLETIHTEAEMYIREDGEVLLIFSVGAYTSEESTPRVKAHAPHLSQRDGISVLLDYYAVEQVEVFEGGRLAHKLDGVFHEARSYRRESWVAGTADPWREWEPGSEPVARYVPPKPECGCTTCEAHTPIDF